MKVVSRIQTFDGVLHENRGDAKRHVDNIYGKELTKIAHEMCRLEKYSKITEYLDANLERFVNLAKIKKDLNIQNEDDD